ncbi:hypothetical protein [Sphingomonas adhaesiva]|uniref:hypothetical protein n=1 Tax=Sphingomonas adhaesiva TaxID=28212 RepID=UPI002FF9766A
MADDGLRLYGTPDHDMDQAPAAGGMRGEGNATPEADAGWRHRVSLDGSRRVEVEEQSGLAYAEATGTVMSAPRAAPSRGVVRAVPLWPLVIAATLGFAAGQRWRRRRERVVPHDAAFAHPVAADGAFARVRDAGPEQMRDRERSWDAVDEGSDESFPASDPPLLRAAAPAGSLTNGLAQPAASSASQPSFATATRSA